MDALISLGMASELKNGAMDRKVCEKGKKVFLNHDYQLERVNIAI